MEDARALEDARAACTCCRRDVRVLGWWWPSVGRGRHVFPIKRCNWYSEESVSQVCCAGGADGPGRGRGGLLGCHCLRVKQDVDQATDLLTGVTMGEEETV